MPDDLHIELTRLRTMTSAALRDRYLDVFGEPSRSGNKDFLFKRIAWRMQANAEGSLSERAKKRAADIACDADIPTKIPPPLTATHAAATAPDTCSAEVWVDGQPRTVTSHLWLQQADPVVTPRGGCDATALAPMGLAVLLLAACARARSRTFLAAAPGAGSATRSACAPSFRR